MRATYVVMGRWITAVLLGVAISVVPFDLAHASDQQRVADVACVVVGLRMLQMNTQQQRAAGMILAAYYLGRLNARLPDAESERLIELEAGKMTSAEFRASATRCGKALSAKGQQIQKISNELSRTGQGGAKEK